MVRNGQGVMAHLLDEGMPTMPEVDQPFPMPVVPDWEEKVNRAGEVCRLIDRHLDYEARGRLLMELDDFRPQNLCPEQSVQMVSDLYAASRR